MVTGLKYGSNLQNNKSVLNSWLVNMKLDELYFDQAWIYREVNYISLRGTKIIGLYLCSDVENTFVSFHPMNNSIVINHIPVTPTRLDDKFYNNGVDRLSFPSSFSDKTLFSTIEKVNFLKIGNMGSSVMKLVKLDLQNGYSFIVEIYDSDIDYLEILLMSKNDAEEYFENTKNNMASSDIA